jgi:hypothetical protein
VEFAFGNGNNDFPPHNLPLHVGIGVGLAVVVFVAGHWLMRGKFFQPLVKVMVEAALIVIEAAVRLWRTRQSFLSARG